MPRERYRHASVAINNQVWLVGGRSLVDDLLENVDVSAFFRSFVAVLSFLNDGDLIILQKYCLFSIRCCCLNYSSWWIQIESLYWIVKWIFCFPMVLGLWHCEPNMDNLHPSRRICFFWSCRMGNQHACLLCRWIWRHLHCLGKRVQHWCCRTYHSRW